MSGSDRKIIIFSQKDFKGPGLVLFGSTEFSGLLAHWAYQARSVVVVAGRWSFNSDSRTFSLSEDNGEYPQLDSNYDCKITSVLCRA